MGQSHVRWLNALIRSACDIGLAAATLLAAKDLESFGAQDAAPSSPKADAPPTPQAPPGIRRP